MKNPNTKLQTPKKSQSPNSKSRSDADGLVLEAWSFSGVWSLEFGVSFSRPSPIASGLLPL
jgi:hypothetical protein